MKANILIVEDEEALALLLRYNLEAEGYGVETVPRGDEADLLLKEHSPDLVILDWMLPGLSGIELCRRLRARPETKQLPIIMLTARGEESERVRGLATGADDYIVKPFSVPELSARVRALLRRALPERLADVLSFGDLEVDREKKRVSRGGRAIDLGPTEYRLLEFLMERPGRVFSREQLLNGVWGSEIYIDERTVDVHVGRLRKALNRGHDTDPIRTVRGAGDARVVRAVGQAGDRLAAAKKEVGMAGIADRPAAGLLVEFEQGAALAKRDDVVDEFRLQLDLELVGLGERGITPYRRPRDPQHVRMGARLARARSGGGWRLGTARQPEPVHLADHGIARNAAKLRSDLARRQPLCPEFLQRFDALIGPGHAPIPRQSPPRRSPDRIPLRAWTTTSWPDAYPRHRFTL